MPIDTTAPIEFEKHLECQVCGSQVAWIPVAGTTGTAASCAGPGSWMVPDGWVIRTPKLRVPQVVGVLVVLCPEHGSQWAAGGCA